MCACMSNHMYICGGPRFLSRVFFGHSLLCLLRQGVPPNPELIGHLLRLPPGWGSLSPTSLEAKELWIHTGKLLHLLQLFYVGAGNLNPSLHAWEVSTFIHGASQSLQSPNSAVQMDLPGPRVCASFSASFTHSFIQEA